MSGGRARSLCPHCGKPWPARQTDWQHAVRAAGRCVRCNRAKTEVDMPFWNCRGCRIIIAANARTRYQRADGRKAAA